MICLSDFILTLIHTDPPAPKITYYLSGFWFEFLWKLSNWCNNKMFLIFRWYFSFWSKAATALFKSDKNMATSLNFFCCCSISPWHFGSSSAAAAFILLLLLLLFQLLLFQLLLCSKAGKWGNPSHHDAISPTYLIQHISPQNLFSFQRIDTQTQTHMYLCQILFVPLWLWYLCTP